MRSSWRGAMRAKTDVLRTASANAALGQRIEFDTRQGLGWLIRSPGHDAEIGGDAQRRARVVPGDDDADAGRMRLAGGHGHFGPRRIDDAHRADVDQPLLEPTVRVRALTRVQGPVRIASVRSAASANAPTSVRMRCRTTVSSASVADPTRTFVHRASSAPGALRDHDWGVIMVVVGLDGRHHLAGRCERNQRMAGRPSDTAARATAAAIGKRWTRGSCKWAKARRHWGTGARSATRWRHRAPASGWRRPLSDRAPCPSGRPQRHRPRRRRTDLSEHRESMRLHRSTR